MNDDRERIIEFDAATSIPADGWLAIDSSTEGTKKVQKSAIIGSGTLDTTSQEVIGAINEVNQKAATISSMTQQQYDDLPSTKLSDNVPRFITDGVPTVDQTLWNKVGTSTLNTTAQNCSDAINELNSKLAEPNPQGTPTNTLSTIGINGTIYDIGGGVNYSTTEQEIGTWIDGKALYQKTIEVTDSFSSTKAYTDNDIANADMLMFVDGYYICSTSSGTYYVPLNYPESGYSSYTGYRAYNHEIYMRLDGFTSSKCVMTVRYTKSTD